MRTRNVQLMIVAMTVAVSVGAATGARAEGDEPAVPVDVPGNDTAVVQTYTTAGQLVSTVAYDLSGAVVPVPDISLPDLAAPKAKETSPGVVTLGSGTGGQSSSSGCRRVTVNNEKESTFGGTLYWFHTWTEWCWNRTNSTISSVRTGWYNTDVDWAQEWRGLTNDQRYFYAWISGKSTSGYYHYKQGHFVNCAGPICGANTYPTNTLRSYSNGTWSWTTSG